MTTLVFAVLFLLLMSALASGSEAALFAVNYAEVVAAEEEKRRGAAALRAVKDELTRPIMAIVIWNNVANIGGSALVGVLAAQTFGSQWVGLFSAVLTLLVIVLAEIFPKTLGEQYSLRICLVVAPWVRLLARILLPLIWLTELLVRPFVAQERQKTSEAEIAALTRLGGRDGAIEKDESEIIQRVFRMNDVNAGMIMTPLSGVDSLVATKKLGELREWLLQVTHSRIPVFRPDDINRVVGVVNVRDILRCLSEDRDELEVSTLATEPFYVASAMRSDDLLRAFQKRKQHLALVVDAMGTVLGVVTLEDVIEELVGEIEDETDVEQQSIVRVSPRALVVQPTTEMRDIGRALGMRLEVEGRVGELLVAHLGRIPKGRERLSWQGLDVVVEQATRRRIVSLRIELPRSGVGSEIEETTEH